MYIAIQSILSIIVVVAFGFYAGKSNLISNKLTFIFSDVVIKFTLPAVLFVSLATTSVNNLLNFKFIIVFLLSIMVIYVVAGVVSYYVFKRSMRISTMIAFACAFPALAFTGIPYVEEVLGNGSSSSVILSVAIGNIITSIVMIPITMVFLEQDENSSTKVVLFERKSIELFKKPLIFAPIFGIIIALLQIQMPKFLMDGLALLGSATSSLALFTLGLLMTKFRFKFSRDVAVVVLLKIIMQPLMAIGFIILCGLKGTLSAEVIMLTAMPTAIVVSIFAEKYQVYQEEVVSVIIASNVVSLVSLVFFTGIAERFIT